LDLGASGILGKIAILNPLPVQVLQSAIALTHVFGFRGKSVSRMHNTAWKNAWRRAGLPIGDSVLSGPHNLRHTFARRLRLAGVPLETRKALMHHIDGDITVHYSPAEVGELLAAVEKLTKVEGVTMLRLAS
jgi:Phage integrase family.